MGINVPVHGTEAGFVIIRSAAPDLRKRGVQALHVILQLAHHLYTPEGRIMICNRKVIISVVGVSKPRDKNTDA